MGPRRIAEDRGSIPLVLLAIISLTMVVAALVSTTLGGTEAARFDEEYTFTIQAADTGAQEGADRLIRTYTKAQLEAVAVPPGCSTTAWASCPTFDSGAGTFNGFPYEWEARKVSALVWLVRSTSTGDDGVTREVVVEVRDTGLFFLAAFSDLGLEMRGGNGADSYGASAWYTGNGIVASNDTIRLNGSSTGVDAVHLYNWDHNPDFNRCRHTGGSDCDDVLATPEARAPSARIGPEMEVGGPILDTQFIDDFRAACPSPLPNYVASTYDGGSGRLGVAGGSTVLCFESVTIDRDVEVYGDVDIYVYGDLRLGNGVEVNCTGCAPGSSTPEATALSFFVDGTVTQSDGTERQTNVAFGNHTAISAGIYAPESACAGNPSNAQADVYGSLICGTISNQGGWSFHYDDRLGDEGQGQYYVSAWREELP